MIKKVKKAFKVLKEQGLGAFLFKTYQFLFFKTENFFRKLAEFYVQKRSKKAIELIKNFNSKTPEETFDFAWKLYFGLIRPVQDRREFCDLLKIFLELKPKYILEIGTANGGSLFCFCKLAPDDAIILSIDLPEGPFGGGYPEWKIPIYQAFKKENQKLYLLRKDSHQKETLDEVLKILNGNELDFLFIDGDHSYEGVKKDFEMYGPLVRKGGIIAFHDIVISNDKSIEVPKFWYEIKKNYNYKEIIAPHRRIYGGGGIGYILKQ